MSRYSRSRSRSRSRHRRRYDRSRSRSRSRSRRRRHRTRSRSAERSPPATAVTSNAPAVATKPPQQLANVTDSTGKPVDPMAILAPGNVNVERTRAARRLFVGNLPISMRLTPAGLQRFFTDALGELGIVTPHPVLSVWINSEGSFCFVELRSVKDTDTSLQLLEGVTLGGRPLRVGRPADYAAAPGSLADFVVPLAMCENVTAPQEKAVPVSNGPVECAESRTLCLRGVLQMPDVANDDNFEDAFDDIVTELQRNVADEKVPLQVDVVAPRPSQFPGDRGVRSVYAQYSTVEAAKATKQRLQGRHFDARLVNIHFYPDERFAAKDFE